MVVAIMAGPIDLFMGGSNLPLFSIASFCAAISAVLAFFVLPEADPHKLLLNTAPSPRKKSIIL